MKLYNFDGMFDEKLKNYIAKNPDKYSESGWENVIPEMYKRFGDTKIKSLDKTPREFYAEMTADELVKCLKAHLKQGVPVSQFLCDAIESAGVTEKLLPLLNGTAEEREYAMGLIGADDRALKIYMELLTTCGDDETEDRCVELLKEKADKVLPEAVKNYKNGVKRGCMLEIMSRSVVRNDEVFDILLKEFRTEPENLALNAGYLAAYGDERALPALLDKIDEEGITYPEYRELKFAVEALGGEYETERDFSSDPYFELINSHNGAENIFKYLKK